MSRILEVCCEDLQSVSRAVRSGAGRIELCVNLGVGGTTPPRQLIQAALQEAGSVPVNVLVRPRGGDFVYSPEEIDAMLESIRLCRDLKVNGVVIGALDEAGNVDTPTVSRLIAEAGSLSVTFHRAFDESRDLADALEDIIVLGVHRLLTSGGCKNAYDGRFVLRDLVKQAAGRIIVMPGCGIVPSNLDEIAEVTGASEFHGSRILVPLT